MYQFCRIDSSGKFWHHVKWVDGNIIYYKSSNPCDYKNIPENHKVVNSSKIIDNDQFVYFIWMDLVSQLFREQIVELESNGNHISVVPKI